jgi:hypothetical protein
MRRRDVKRRLMHMVIDDADAPPRNRHSPCELSRLVRARDSIAPFARRVCKAAYFAGVSERMERGNRHRRGSF